jgi:dihydroneopterin aldolase
MVVKLGGSLAGSAELGAWLEVLGRAGGGRAIVVPGGGPFADQVRAAQRSLGFDDGTAHHLAILAMEQFGRVLAALGSGLVPADSRRAVERALAAGKVAVWLPARMTLGRPEIAESWAVTSDSLAAWLAGVLGVRHLALVKSAAPPPGPVAADELARRGLVDPMFSAFLAASGTEAWCLGPGEGAGLALALRGDGVAGSRILAPR